MSVPSGKHCRATRTGYLTLSNQNLAKHITEVIQKQRNLKKEPSFLSCSSRWRSSCRLTRARTGICQTHRLQLHSELVCVCVGMQTSCVTYTVNCMLSRRHPTHTHVTSSRRDLYDKDLIVVLVLRALRARKRYHKNFGHMLRSGYHY